MTYDETKLINHSPTKEEFFVLLNRHDWHYQMADDFRSWKNGQQKQDLIDGLAKREPYTTWLNEWRKSKP